jgi:hypothetical protein
MLGADIAIIAVCVVFGAAIAGAIGKKLDARAHSRERKGRKNASDIRIENRFMCIQCWTPCDPEKGDVLVGDAWWCRRCYKEMMK